MPQVQLMAEGALARAQVAPVPELACEALTQGIQEIMEACLKHNHLQGSDLGIAYQVCKTALQRLIASAAP